MNLFERIEDEQRSLLNVRTALAPEERASVLVPQNPRLLGSLNEVLGHQRCYTRETLTPAWEATGFTVERVGDFNHVTTPAWWFNGQVLRCRQFSKVQLKVLNSLTGLFRRLDFPCRGHR